MNKIRKTHESLLALFYSIFISPEFQHNLSSDFISLIQNFLRKNLFQKYANSAVNFSSLVERQGIKYQVNLIDLHFWEIIMYMDDLFSVSKRPKL